MGNSNSSFSNQNIENDDGINLKDLFHFFFRNRMLIGSFSILFLTLSIFYSLIKKNIWEGGFQIVLDIQDNNNLPLNFLNNTNLQGFSSLNIKQPSTLKTEVAILESPFVLMPVFDYVLDQKNILNSKPKKINFTEWRDKNLKIELKKGTSVLEISYRDDNKNLIKPVLQKMSKIYQEYSGKSKKRNFELAINYLNDQKSIYKNKSFESLREAQEYAIEQDLTIIDLDSDMNNLDKMSNPTNPNKSNPFISNIGIENIRVSAANKIRNIDIQIQKIADLDDDVKQLQYIGSTIPGLVEEGLPEILENIETELIELRSKYTENDPVIIRLLKKRQLFVKLLKERSIGYLKAERLTSEAVMLSAMRPKGVLLKYKELIREANRDEKTLIELENQLKVVNLEKARLEDPWKLITNPTLSDDPVAPKKLRISLFGLILGFIFGSTFSLVKEKINIDKFKA